MMEVGGLEKGGGWTRGGAVKGDGPDGREMLVGGVAVVKRGKLSGGCV